MYRAAFKVARKFGANCSKCQRSTEQQQSIKCFKIHSKDLLQNNDFHITSSIFLLASVLVFYFFLILFFNSIVYRFFIARIFGVLPEYFRDWGGCRPPPRPPGSYAYAVVNTIFPKKAARWNFQFDIGKQRRNTLFRFMNTLVQFCGEHAGSVSCRFCVLDLLLSNSFPEYSNY